LAASPEPIQGVLLDLELTNELDVPSADMLRELDDDLDAAGVQLMLARSISTAAFWKASWRI
jgi:hypothetical protein